IIWMQISFSIFPTTSMRLIMANPRFTGAIEIQTIQIKIGKQLVRSGNEPIRPAAPWTSGVKTTHLRFVPWVPWNQRHHRPLVVLPLQIRRIASNAVADVNEEPHATLVTRVDQFPEARRICGNNLAKIFRPGVMNDDGLCATRSDVVQLTSA